MPQFDPTFYASQLFWLYVSFGLLFVLLSVIAIPRIDAVLENRRITINDNIDKAEILRTEAHALLQHYENALIDSHLQAKKIKLEDSETFLKESEILHKELANKLDEHIKSSETRIAQAKESATEEIRDIAVATTQKMLEKLVGISLKEEILVNKINTIMQEKHR
jgi:F-type H+-transporting ATPase subunit b